MSLHLEKHPLLSDRHLHDEVVVNNQETLRQLRRDTETQCLLVRYPTPSCSLSHPSLSWENYYDNKTWGAKEGAPVLSKISRTQREELLAHLVEGKRYFLEMIVCGHQEEAILRGLAHKHGLDLIAVPTPVDNNNETSVYRIGREESLQDLFSDLEVFAPILAQYAEEAGEPFSHQVELDFESRWKFIWSLPCLEALEKLEEGPETFEMQMIKAIISGHPIESCFITEARFGAPSGLSKKETRPLTHLSISLREEVELLGDIKMRAVPFNLCGILLVLPYLASWLFKGEAPRLESLATALLVSAILIFLATGFTIGSHQLRVWRLNSEVRQAEARLDVSDNS